MSLTTSIISGALGGLFATVAANFLWRIYTRPHLTLLSGTVRKYAYSSNENISGIVHKGIVNNRGLSAANNCKISIFLFGIGNGRTYQIDYGTVWSESGYPSRLTINRSGLVNFDLLKIEETSDKHVIRFPSENGWESPATIQTWDREFRYDLPERKFPIENGEDPKLMEELDMETIADIEWLEGRVTLYSENAKKQSSHMKISIEDGELNTRLPGSVSRYGIQQHSKSFRRLFERIRQNIHDLTWK